MPGSAQLRYLGRHRSSCGRDGSPVRSPAPHDVTTYVRDFSAYFGTSLFAKFPSSGTAMMVPYGPQVCDTVVGAWRERWKRKGGHVASGLQGACSQMD